MGMSNYWFDEYDKAHEQFRRGKISRERLTQILRGMGMDLPEAEDDIAAAIANSQPPLQMEAR